MKNVVHISWFTSIINHALWNVPEQIRALWRIPIGEVIEAMGMKFEEVDGCDFVHYNDRETARVEINPLSNDWQFGYDEQLTYDHFEVKSTIDLVMLLDKEHDFESAVAFLLEKFPAYRIEE